MRWISILAAVALSMVASICSADELKINVSSFPPGKPLQPGTAVLLSVDGLEPGQSATWHRVAVEGDIILKLDAHHLFAGVKPGPRTFIVQVASPGADPFAITTFDYGVSGDPTPDPTPPPIPGDYAQIVVIEEQHDRTQAQATVMDDPVWQLIVLKKGATYRIEDKDLKIRDQATGKDITPPWLTPLLKAVVAAKVDLPAVCFVDGSGKVTGVVALPVAVFDDGIPRKLIKTGVQGMRELVK